MKVVGRARDLSIVPGLAKVKPCLNPENTFSITAPMNRTSPSQQRCGVVADRPARGVRGGRQPLPGRRCARRVPEFSRRLSSWHCALMNSGRLNNFEELWRMPGWIRQSSKARWQMLNASLNAIKRVVRR